MKFLRNHFINGLMILLTVRIGLIGLLSVPHLLMAQAATDLPALKNFILIIGDGMGYNAIQATDFYQGARQPFEEFPVRLAVSTYPAKAGENKTENPLTNDQSGSYDPDKAWKDTGYVRKNVTESSAAATALATGVKTYNSAIGMSVGFDTLLNLVEIAKSVGKSAGVVTTVPFSHATPAAFVAHNKSRSNYSQIAFAMLFNSRCDLIMGCGNPQYDDDGRLQEKKWKNTRYVGDSLLWVQLVEGSGIRTQFVVNGKQQVLQDSDGDGSPDPWTVIRDIGDFRALGNGPAPRRVLGCPEVYSTLQQSRSPKSGETRDSQPFFTPYLNSVPSLAEMVQGALNVLGQNPRGFFLMIEAGAIDWAEHDKQKGRLIEEMTGLTKAVRTIVEWVGKNSNWEETLVVVTADHESGYLWGGLPFTPLRSNGPGKLPVMKFNSTDHTNSLVPFFAKGAGSEMFRNYADELDPERGPYIQNTEIAGLIRLLWLK